MSTMRVFALLSLSLVLCLGAVDAQCNLNEGSWQRDDKYPQYYSADSCKSLKKDFACKGRNTDYLKYVWKSPGCNIQRFDRNNFLNMIKNKLIIQAGDSFMHNLEASIKCSIGSITAIQDFSGVVVPGTPKVQGFKVPAANATFIHGTSSFLTVAEPLGEAKASGTWKISLDKADPVWAALMKYSSYTIFAAGHWFVNGHAGKDRLYYIGGKQQNIDAISAAGKAMETVKNYANSINYKGMALFMTYTAKHYNEQFAGDQDCDNVNQPLNGDGLAYASGHSDAMQLRDAQVNALRGSNFKIVDVTRASLARADAHVQDGDCSHFCAPGLPETWADIVYSYMAHAI